MNQLWPQSWVAALLVAVLAAVGAPAWADPPYRVMQLAHASGSVSFQPASTDEWLRATPNRPLVPGDALWVDGGARAELRTTGTALRLHENTSVELLNLDDRIAQLRLSQGTLILSVRRIGAGQVIEIDTPNLAFRPARPGLYRIEVAPSGEWTDVAMRRGAAHAFGEGRAFTLAEGRTLRFYGTDLADHDSFALAPRDAFDRWSSERDQRRDNAVASRYVSPELIGHEDLEGHGRWQRHVHYGAVWIPERLPAGWAPYRHGHWAWIEPWGWTWIDDAPWGFAPSHYGRWTRVDTAWAWVPGPVRMRPVYAPAMVQFVGTGAQVGASFTLGGVAAVAWFALGPQEVYRPAYAASPAYLRAMNLGNALIPSARITNITVNSTQVIQVYANPRQGALVAMPAADFARSRPVAAAALRVAPQDLLRAPVASAPATRPTLASIVGAAPRASGQPPREAVERRVIARAAPPVRPAPRLPDAERGRLAEADPARRPEAARAPAPAAARRAAPEVRVVQAPAATVPLPRAEGRGGRRAEDSRDARAPAPAPAPEHAQVQRPERRQAPQPSQQQAGEQRARPAPRQGQELSPREAAAQHQAQQLAQRQARERAVEQARQQARQQAAEAAEAAPAARAARAAPAARPQAEHRPGGGRRPEPAREQAPRDEPRGQARMPGPPPVAPSAAQPPHPRAPAEPAPPRARLEPPHARAPAASPRQDARAEPPRAAPRSDPPRTAPPGRADTPREQRAAAEAPRKGGAERPREKGRHRDEG